MKREELEAIRERAKDATEGPWSHEPNSSNEFVIKGGRDEWYQTVTYCDDDPECGCIDEAHQNFHDGEFLAHSREDIPALLDDNHQLEKWIEHLIREYHDMCDDRGGCTDYNPCPGCSIKEKLRKQRGD